MNNSDGLDILMHERDLPSASVFTITHADLRYCRPDLKAQIDALDEFDLTRIADRIGEELHETIWMALGIVLAKHLSVEEQDDNEIEDDER